MTKSVIWGFEAQNELKPMKIYITMKDEEIVIKGYSLGIKVLEESYPYMKYSLLEEKLKEKVNEPYVVVQDTLLMLARESILDNYVG